MSKADCCKDYLLSTLHYDYQLGGEGTDIDHDGRREIDCSGLYHQMNIHCGFPISDDTAHGYYNKTKPRKGSPKPGDAGFKRNSRGKVHHMCVCIGDGTIVEARSSSFPRGHQIQRRKESQFAASSEFVGWRYWPGHNFGKLGGEDADQSYLVPGNANYHTRAIMVRDSQLWNWTTGTRRYPSPKKGGIVHVIGRLHTQRIGALRCKRTIDIWWWHNSKKHKGRVRYSDLRWCDDKGRR